MYIVIPMWTLANILTIARLFLLPVIILFFYIPTPWAAWTCLTLYIVGAITDWLDGWVARKYDQISDLGTFLDPIADKIFIVILLLMLVATDRIEGFWVLAVVIILIRELLVSGLREFLGPKGIKLPVTPLAKWKTALQMLATGLLIIGPFVAGTHIIGLLCLCGAAAVTVVTGRDYIKTAWPHLQ